MTERNVNTGVHGWVVALLLLGLVDPRLAEAQTNDEIGAGLQFSFASPGARSLAMGGAFAGLADDATAAYTNPAGLLWLRKPEVSIETRSSNYTTRYVDGGTFSGEPSLCTEGDSSCLDTAQGLQLSAFDSRVDNVQFLSYVFPFKRSSSAGATSEAAKRRWSLGLFRHEAANFEVRIDGSQGAFLGGEETGRGVRTRLSGLTGELTLKVETLGVAFAGELLRRPEWRLWAGLTVNRHELDLEAVTRRYRSIAARSDGVNPALTGPIDFSAENETDRHLQNGTDSDVAFNVGLLWKTESDRWSAGAVFRQAPRFAFDYAFFWGPSTLALAAELENPNLADPGVERALSGTAEFAVPDVVSAGIAYRPWSQLLFALESSHVRYSNLQPESNLLVNGLRAGSGDCGDFDSRGNPKPFPNDCPIDTALLSRFRLDDATEWHMGLEYVFASQPKVSLRAGAWLDPDHQLRFEPDANDVLPGESVTVDNLRPPGDRLAARFQPGDDEVHLTAGLGIVPLRESLQLDLAVDLSDRADIFSISAVFRW